jgi:hypothetical protein
MVILEDQGHILFLYSGQSSMKDITELMVTIFIILKEKTNDHLHGL